VQVQSVTMPTTGKPKTGQKEDRIMASKFESFIVRSAGSVDVAATLSKFENDLLDHLANEELANADVSAAVHAVFDQYLGACLNMPALVGAAFAKLGLPPSEFGTVGERIADYARNSGQFKVSKGKGGGVRRLRDIAE
jgi:hypothetical protein